MPWVKKIKVNRHECAVPGVHGPAPGLPGIRVPKYELGSQWGCRKCGQRWELKHSQVTWVEVVTPGLKEVPRAHTPWYKQPVTYAIVVCSLAPVTITVAAGVAAITK